MTAPRRRWSVAANVRKSGQQARYDGEGIAIDTSIIAPIGRKGWWIASEGNASSNPNLLVQVDRFGRTLREIQLPSSIDQAADPSLPGSAPASATGATVRSNGFEGVALSQNNRFLVAAIQREFANGGAEFPSGDKFTRIAVYDLQQLDTREETDALCNGWRCGGDWDFYFYTMDSNDLSNWAGLSEIIPISANEYVVIERDGEIGAASQLKKVYAFSLGAWTPTPTAGRAVLRTTPSTKSWCWICWTSFSLTRRPKVWPYLPTATSGLAWTTTVARVESRLINTGPFENPFP